MSGIVLRAATQEATRFILKRVIRRGRQTFCPSCGANINIRAKRKRSRNAS